MSNFRKYTAYSLAVMVSVSSIAHAQEVATPNTLWRFIGIPQGIQKIRDVSINRRGNFPALERKPAMKRIADPANLESPNPAIKAAAEIKTAEDMKKQKIKAIKYLATIGCGCYDKDGKITDAILAATDDCTPDVRMAAIEAIEEAANGECCRKCGSTSCCNEKVTKRLSEIAYERDDDGCPLEPNAEIRQAAKRVLCKCCPGGPPSGPIEEEMIDDDGKPLGGETLGEPIRGESADEQIKGESSDEDGQGEASESDDDPTLNLPEPADEQALETEPIRLLLIGGMKVQPAVINPVSFDDSDRTVTPASVLKPQSIPSTPDQASHKVPTPIRALRSQHYRPVGGEVSQINFKTGEILFSADNIEHVNPNGSADVFHRYLTGERKVARLSVKGVGSNRVKAQVIDPAMIGNLHVGDRIVVR